MDYKILTSGRLSSDFKLFIKNYYPDIEIVEAKKDDEIESLLPEVNTIAGFNFLKDQDVSKIKWIHAFGAGVDSYLKLKTLNPDVIITRTTGDLGKQMGEFCLTYILAEVKKIFPIYDNQRKTTWQQIPASSLSDLNVLILGTGSIGMGVAQQLNDQVNKVIGLNRSGSPVDPFHETCSWETLSKIQDVHVVISALPSTPGTAAILDESFFQLFNDIIFINVGRGDAVDENVLLKVINLGQVKKAILDVFPEEPLPKDSKLWNSEKVLVSPHQSGLTTIDDVSKSFELAFKAIKNGGRNSLFVDLEKGY